MPPTTLSAIPPWPPDDYTAAMPFDQRGCCWPVGPCGYSQKIPMRFTCIGTREFGAGVGVPWGNLATGITMVPQANWISELVYRPFANDPVPPASTMRIYWDDVDAIWRASATFHAWLAPPVYATCNYSGVMTDSACGSDFTLEHGLFGPVELATFPPDFLTFSWLDWWETSGYPVGSWW